MGRKSQQVKHKWSKPMGMVNALSILIALGLTVGCDQKIKVNKNEISNSDAAIQVATDTSDASTSTNSGSTATPQVIGVKPNSSSTTTSSSSGDGDSENTITIQTISTKAAEPVATPTPVFNASISINSGALFANSTSVNLALYASEATEMYITNVANCASGGTYTAYATSQQWTIGQSNGTATVYVKYKNKDGQESECVSDTITHDGVAPDSVGDLQFSNASPSLNQSPSMSWDAFYDGGSGVVRYEGALGTGPGLTDIVNWSNIGLVTTYQFLNLNLQSGTFYYPSIAAVDAAGNTSDPLEGSSFTALIGVKKIGAGMNHTCVILNNDKLKCWGSGASGTLGYGDTVTRGDGSNEMGRYLPYVSLGTGITISAFDAGWDNSCALFTNGRVKCWGKGSYGIPGNGNFNAIGDDSSEMGSSLTYIELGTNRTTKSLSLGWEHVCAILDDDTLKCWGANDNGNLGIGDVGHRGDGANEMGNSLSTVSLGTGLTPVEVATSWKSSCARFSNGKVKCWGGNEQGQLGLGDINNRGDAAGEMGDSLPFVDLGTGITATSLCAGALHVCAVLNNGGVKCWGDNAYGNLGLGDTADRGDGTGEMGDNLPQVSFGSGLTVAKCASQWQSTCAIFTDGTAKCWGGNGFARLGTGNSSHLGDGANEMGSNLPFLNLGSGVQISDMTCGTDQCCALLSNSRVKCWGLNSLGQLGLGDTNNRGDATGEMGDSLPYVGFD
jgi:alpha-tubulin suppressor-like RCC1 family protein